MKKIISIFVAEMMVVSLFSVSAGAIDIDDRSENGTLEGAEKDKFGGSTSADVLIKIGDDYNHRYAVDITFSAPVFTPSSNAIWDASKHQYYHDEDLEWIGEGEVSIKNHSDMAITYAATAEIDNAAAQYGDLAIVFGEAAEYAPIPATRINGCPVGAVTVPSATFTYGVVGVPDVATLAETKLGIITVTIAPV